MVKYFKILISFKYTSNVNIFHRKQKYFIYFFCIDTEKSFTIRGEKVLCPSLFDKTIIHISITIINQNYEKSEVVLLKAKSIINLVSICILYFNSLYYILIHLIYFFKCINQNYLFYIYLKKNIFLYGLQILKKKFLLIDGLEYKMNKFLEKN